MMNIQNTQNQLKSKKTGYCITEVKAMVDVIFQNITRIQNSGGEVPEDVFESMAKATEGKRTAAQMRLWYYDLKKIREHEKRFTKIVKKALTTEDQEKLHEIMFAKGPPLGDALSSMSLYPFLEKQQEYEEQEVMDKENAMNSSFQLPPPPYQPAPTKETKKKGIGCFGSAEKEEPYGYPTPTAPPEDPMETLRYHELGEEKQEDVSNGHQ